MDSDEFEINCSAGYSNEDDYMTLNECSVNLRLKVALYTVKVLFLHILVKFCYGNNVTHQIYLYYDSAKT